MAHFAQVNENGIVTQVIVVANSDCGGGEFPDSEAPGQAFIASLGLSGEWRQTSYNNNFRKRYAGIGYAFREDLDAFLAPQPYPSWTLNEETADWEAPVPMPTEGIWKWDEENQEWDEVTPLEG